MVNITDINDNNSETRTESNDSINNNNIIKKQRGRPISLYWRFDENGVLIIKRPSRHDCDYHYYHDVAGCKIECPVCNRCVNQDNIFRHQRSNMCLKIAGEKCCL